jgi:hypothetical protein
MAQASSVVYDQQQDQQEFLVVPGRQGHLGSANITQRFDDGRISYGFNRNYLRGYKPARSKMLASTVLFVEAATGVNVSTASGYYFAVSVADPAQPVAYPFHGRNATVAWLDGMRRRLFEHRHTRNRFGLPGTLLQRPARRELGRSAVQAVQQMESGTPQLLCRALGPDLPPLQ